MESCRLSGRNGRLTTVRSRVVSKFDRANRRKEHISARSPAVFHAGLLPLFSWPLIPCMDRLSAACTCRPRSAPQRRTRPMRQCRCDANRTLPHRLWMPAQTTPAGIFHTSGRFQSWIAIFQYSSWSTERSSGDSILISESRVPVRADRPGGRDSRRRHPVCSGFLLPPVEPLQGEHGS